MKNIKRDCFALKNGMCSILECNNCRDCKTYKTKEQIEIEKHRTFNRIKTLSPEQQSQISDKYYAGKAPWNPAQTFRPLEDIFNYDLDIFNQII